MATRNTTVARILLEAAAPQEAGEQMEDLAGRALADDLAAQAALSRISHGNIVGLGRSGLMPMLSRP